MLDNIMSSSSLETESDSVMRGQRMSSMKLFTFPECSSLQIKRHIEFSRTLIGLLENFYYKLLISVII